MFIECNCNSPEHVFKFTLEKEDNWIIMEPFLCHYNSFLKRIWLGLKYILGYKSKTGHFDTVLIGVEKAKLIRDICEELINEA